MDEPPRTAPEGDATGWWIYLLRCRDGTLYCGVTNRLAERLRAHNAGRGARYTRGRRPVELVWAGWVPDRAAALRGEALIKRWSRARKMTLVRRGRPTADGG
ncbi:MAG: GIY-YIG nuclease family protein [Actinomycetia bacterium]|nr:GIY-YIG nuclease family protein [Actinomycetes bacterium]